ncbi:PTS system, glucose-specific IIB component [Vibrio ishigakensis]|uniref:PTS system, glucose-specific IIB component n=1 Tax=Vibrio ishigakensis TaxID=1481914 RepID=A0A0B8PA04_9VIBR|nr:PTS system, glucose-specific IIB component [Vibrio ishigakensis]
MFISPALYVIHSIIAGLAYPLCIILGVKHGYSFSAGLIDYVTFFGISTKGWMIITGSCLCRYLLRGVLLVHPQV